MKFSFSSLLGVGVLGWFAGLAPSFVQARVTGIEIAHRADVLGGQSFGSAGAYEKLSGRINFAVQPGTPANRRIVDLELAPRNAAGDVEFSADFFILKPKDPARGNGAMLCEVSNRGGKGMLSIIDRGSASLDPTAAADFGDGFLLKRGFTLAWVGWQADVLPGGAWLHLYAPVAHAPVGGVISGLVRADFAPWESVNDWPLAHLLTGKIGGVGYPMSGPQEGADVLTVRDLAHGPRTPVAASAWQFGRSVPGGGVAADPAFVHLARGFEPGRIYEVIYRAQNPRVAGLGFAAVRDFLSYSKYDPASPAPVQRTYAMGISQTGRFLRHFLYEDFNADEQGRPAIDGVIAHVGGAGRGSFNERFAQPSRDAQSMASIDYPTDLFPFTDLPETDPVTGETDGLLTRAAASHTVPKIFLSNTSHEYWGRAAALIHTTPDGQADTTVSPEVRIYFFAGLQHFSGPFPATAGVGDLHGQEPMDPNPVAWLWRAMVVNLDAWVRDGTAPPDSRYPRLSDGTLVPRAQFTFPAIPGVGPTPAPLQAFRLDFGPQWKEGIVTLEPPRVGAGFPVLVPQVDADGNDRGGVLIPEMAVPLASYPGWNLRAPVIGAPTQRVAFLGSYLPFPRTAAERARTGDSRRSVAERYPSPEAYAALYAAAAQENIRERFLLAEDLSDILDRGAVEWRAVMGAPKNPN